MFGDKGKTNGAVEAQPQGMPRGVQMLLQSMGFDPNAVVAQIMGMMTTIEAARQEFTQRLEGLRVGLGDHIRRSETLHERTLTTIQEQGQSLCNRLDVVIEKMGENNRLQWAAIEEIQQCLKLQRTQRPLKRR
jgi:hypothetical protein